MRGYYQTSEVDRIERDVVTEAMIDYAIRQGLGDPRAKLLRTRVALCYAGRRSVARRNIAIGINCGSYSIVQFKAEQAMRRLAPVKV